MYVAYKNKIAPYYINKNYWTLTTSFYYFFTYDLVWVEQGIGVEGETGVAGPILPSWSNKTACLLNNIRCLNKHRS